MADRALGFTSSAHAQLGMIRAQLGQLDDGVSHLREAVRLDPSKIAYHKLLGQALNKNPKWRKQAETHLRRGVLQTPRAHGRPTHVSPFVARVPMA